jgi:uncharacterized membrane protein YphA (DoxX/SURF4 family)
LIRFESEFDKLAFAYVLRKANLRRSILQRLFSTFPAGWPGVGLLLLRAVAGFTLLIHGTAYLTDWRTLRFDSLIAVVLAFAGGLCLLAGILTPVTSILVALGTIAYAFSWVPEPAANLFASKIAIVYVIAVAIAIAFLGPGAFSMDARLFGRREIFIPVNPRSQKS